MLVVSCAFMPENYNTVTIAIPHINVPWTDKNLHTTLPHVSQTTAAPITSTGTKISVVVTSTQVPPTNDHTPSVLTGAVSGGAAILLVMIVSTLVVILMVKTKRTRDKAGHSVNSCTGLSNNVCCVL